MKYLFLTNDGLEEHSKLTLEPFNASAEQNDYEVRCLLLAHQSSSRLDLDTVGAAGSDC